MLTEFHFWINDPFKNPMLSHAVHYNNVHQWRLFYGLKRKTWQKNERTCVTLSPGSRLALKSAAWNAEFSLCIVIQCLCGLEQKCLLAARDVTQSIVWLFMPDERQTSMLQFFHGCCTGYRAESPYSISTKPSAQRFPTITFSLPFSLSQLFVYNRWLRQPLH